MTGRPSDYSPDLAVEICVRVASGQSVRAIAQADDMPAMSTIFKWLSERKEFSEQYVRAREAQADYLAEEIIEISDDSSFDTIKDEETGNVRQNTEFVNRSRLRVDTRKWLMARIAPKKYGDKLAVTGADGGAVKSEVTVIELVGVPAKAGDEPSED